MHAAGRIAVSFASALLAHVAHAGPPGDVAAVTFRSLLSEMSDPGVVARWPSPAYRQMQASSYNRASTKRGEPNWFADSDGLGFLRVEEREGRKEWVAMEYEGPGCLTRLWAPFFYNDLNTHDVPIVRIYLDGSPTPTMEERWIPLLTNLPSEGRRCTVPAPFASLTARAGDLYLPIPFGTSCKVTFDRPPFYNIVNWRAYEPGTKVESFSTALVHDAGDAIVAAGRALTDDRDSSKAEPAALLRAIPGETHPLNFEGAPLCITELAITLDPTLVTSHPELLRTLILRIAFDGEETVWCPLGDFFGSPNALNPFATAARSCDAKGLMTCRWPMPSAERITIRLDQMGTTPVECPLRLTMEPRAWDERSMHFHASWRPDHVQPGNEFVDLNFIDIRGQGVLVGDQLTVLNPTDGWWGEGDEKIYVDGAYDRGFPDHFGTGTEDYYGWAGGVNPTWADLFSHPFLANIAVGSHAGAKAAGGTTRGFNICTRQRSLDAIPFRERLVFEMEASPGVDQRRAEDRLGYSTVVFWYARPGATSNRAPQPEAAAKPIMSFESLRSR